MYILKYAYISRWEAIMSSVYYNDIFARLFVTIFYWIMASKCKSYGSFIAIYYNCLILLLILFSYHV